MHANTQAEKDKRVLMGFSAQLDFGLEEHTDLYFHAPSELARF
jgi:hypothetical protein